MATTHEFSTQVTDTVDISNAQRFGRPAHELGQDMLNAVNRLIRLEHKLV